MATPVLIHEAVAQRSATKPGATAVISGAERLSYAELEASASRVAHALRAQGVSRGSIVPVMLPRSAQLITVLLGVLKCGAAYAAMDPRWPTERARALVDRLSPSVLGPVSSHDQSSGFALESRADPVVRWA
ncbi:AMP-binding protein [Streptomyces cellulosae]